MCGSLIRQILLSHRLGSYKGQLRGQYSTQPLALSLALSRSLVYLSPCSMGVLGLLFLIDKDSCCDKTHLNARQ